MRMVKLFAVFGVSGFLVASKVEGYQIFKSVALALDEKRRLSPQEVQLSNDGRLFAALSHTFSTDRSVRFYVWGRQTGKVVASWPLQTLDKFAVAPRGRTVAIVSKRQIYSENLRHGYYDVCSVQLRDLYSGQLKQTIIVDGSLSANVYSLAWSDDGKFLATGSGDGLARIWDVDSGRRVASLRAGGYVGALQFSPDAKYLATVGENYDNGVGVKLWNWRLKKLLGTGNFPNYSIYATLTFSNDGKYLAIANTSQGTTALVNVPRLQLKETLPPPTDVQVNSIYPTPRVAFSPQNNLFAFAGGDNMIVRSLASANPVLLHQLKKPSSSPDFSAKPYALAMRFLPSGQLCWVTANYRFVYEAGMWGLTSPQMYTTTLPIVPK